jgi:hypothetical protein
MKMWQKWWLVFVLCITSLVAAEIELMPMRRQSAAIVEASVYNSDICAICLDGYTAEGSAVLFYSVSGKTCGHQFHEDCLNNWRQRSPVCPYCRFSSGGQVSSLDRLNFVFGVNLPWYRKLFF